MSAKKIAKATKKVAAKQAKKESKAKAPAAAAPAPAAEVRGGWGINGCCPDATASQTCMLLVPACCW